MNVQILSAILCPGRMRSPDAFAARLGPRAFSRRNQIWKRPPLFWREPIFRRRVSSVAAIFFLHQHSGKRDTPARVEHRASLHPRTQARELPEFHLWWQRCRLHLLLKQATRQPPQYAAILGGEAVREIDRYRVQGAQRGPLR